MPPVTPTSLTGSNDPEKTKPLSNSERERIADEVAKRLASRQTRLRRWFWGFLAAAGIGGTVYARTQAGFELPDWLRKLIGMQSNHVHKDASASEVMKRSRQEAGPALDRIIPTEQRLGTEALTDAEILRYSDTLVLAIQDRIGKKGTSEDWELFALQQELQIIYTQRRLEALERPDAAEPDRLYARLPLYKPFITSKTKGAEGLGTRLKIALGSSDAYGTRWKSAIDVLSNPKTEQELIDESIADITRILAERRFPFYADGVTAIATEGGLVVSPLVKQRLIRHETKTLKGEILQRWERVGQAKSYSATLNGLRSLSEQYARCTALMQKNNQDIGSADKVATEMKMRLSLIETQSSKVARLTMLQELRVRAFSLEIPPEECKQWQTRFRAECERYFGTSKVPPDQFIAKRLWDDRELALIDFRAELNNDHPMWVRLEAILWRLANAVQERGGDQGFEEASAFLRETEKSEDSRTKAAREILLSLGRGGRLDLPAIQDAQARMRKGQELPFANSVIDLLSSMARQHREAMEKGDMRDPKVRASLTLSRKECAESIMITMQTLLNIRDERRRSQSALPAARIGFDLQGKTDNAHLQVHSTTGDIEADQRRQAREMSDVQEFLNLLKQQHTVHWDDRMRDAAWHAVKVIRRFVGLFDEFRMGQGQKTPQSIRFKELLEEYDPQPLTELADTYEALIAFMDHEKPGARPGEKQKTGSTAQIVEDRKAANDADIQLHREHLGKQQWTPESLKTKLDGATSPAERIALRLAIEDQLERTKKKFLHEELANLLAWVEFATQMQDVKGEMQESQHELLFFLLAVALGLVTLRYPIPYWIAAKLDQRRKRREIRRGGLEVHAAIAAEEGKREAAAETVAIQEAVQKLVSATNTLTPRALLSRVSRLAKRFNKLTLADMATENAAPLAEASDALRHELNTVRGAHETTTHARQEPPVIADQVSIRVHVEPLLQAITDGVEQARQTVDQGTLHPDNATRDALEDLHGNAAALLGFVRENLEPHLPSENPRLADTDLHQCSEATLRLLAAQENMPFDGKVNALRRKLIGRKRKLLAQKDTPIDPAPPATDV